MLTDARVFFREYFEKFFGFAPYPWQEAVFERIIKGDWPDTISAPTGSGKTALIVIWALAFAWSRLQPDPLCRVPRRLDWIVNNRVVVDQATDDANKLRHLLEALPDGDPVKNVFAACAVSGGPLLAISTLRGQFEDNEEWKRDPSRPAIIIGTVDLIGSSLLFRGYREGRYWRASNAGLLGVDTLIVNDEAHLTPAFEKLLRGVDAMNPAGRLPGKTFQVLYLSATARGGSRFEHSFQEDVERSEYFQKIFTAPKHLRIERAVGKVEEASIAAGLAEPRAPRTLLFIDKPEEAWRATERIAKSVGDDHVELLTGTMRGYERNRLAESAVFQRFVNKEVPGEPYWLVCTAAGEVGVNLTSERLVTGLATADRLLQRFGRLNRFGREKPGEAVLVVGTVADPAQEDTLAYLSDLPVNEDATMDVSCEALHRCPPDEKSMSPAPVIARLEPRLIDIWAQTCRPDGGVVPRVAGWLHGKQEDDAETEVAWRDDVRLLASVDDTEQIREVFEKYRVLPHERLREPSYRVADKLKRIPEEQRDERVLSVGSDGEVKAPTLRELIADIAQDFGVIAYRLLVFPAGCGVPIRGMFQPMGESEGLRDVAEEWPSGKRRRIRLWEGGAEWIGSARAEVADDELLVRDRGQLFDFAAGNGYGKPVVVVLPSGEDTDEHTRDWLVYFPARSTARGGLRRRVKLESHLKRVADWAVRLVERLGLDEFRDDFETAGERHDLGKREKVWKKAMGLDPEGPDFAKTAGRVAPRLLGGFRHEFKSLMDSGAATDLARHLIATHHGYGRPYFERRQYGREGLRESEAGAMGAANRFARLQDRYGAWGLAYLEAVFKAADGMASAEEEQEASVDA